MCHIYSVCVWGGGGFHGKKLTHFFLIFPFFANMIIYNKSYEQLLGDPSGRVVYRVCLRPFAWWDSGFESRWGYGCLSFVSVVNYQVEVFATGWSRFRRSPAECGGSECNRETSTMRRPWPTWGCCVMEKKINNYWKTLNNAWTCIKMTRYDS
jgi:hypothetical protein